MGRTFSPFTVDTGLERLFLSLGAEGVYAADHREQVLVPCCPARVKNATGGGDAFAAALAWAWLEGKNLADSALAANAAAAIAVEGEETINPILSPEEVGRRMKQMEV